MSTNADTIRGAVEAERNRLVPGTVEKYPAAEVSVRILDVEAVLAEVEQLRAALEQKAAEPCIFEGEIPCPHEWPDDRVQWCAPCFAREALEAVRG